MVYLLIAWRFSIVLVPSGKRANKKRTGKKITMLLMGKLTISIGQFSRSQTVSLPEGGITTIVLYVDIIST